jgi:hypothetical protein
MATKRNSTTALPPIPGYQRFTIEIADEDAALLLAALEEQRAFSDARAAAQGFPPLNWTPENMAAAAMVCELRRRAELRQNAQARTEGGAQ